MPRKRTILIAGAAVALAAAGTGAGVALAGGDDGDAAVSGPEGARASAAALALYPGATVNSVERDSENGATWEVEVERAGTKVDVRLDASYELVVAESDHEAG